jgi:hypothetical protein
MTIFTVGRGNTNDIALEHKSVSRRHAEIEVLPDGQYRVRDLGSTYGTQVNDGHGWVDASDITVGGDVQIRFGDMETHIGSLLAVVSLVPHEEARAIAPNRIVRAKTDTDSQTSFSGRKPEISRTAWWMIGIAGGVLVLLLIGLIALLLLG